jgi:hypothetical protein
MRYSPAPGEAVDHMSGDDTGNLPRTVLSVTSVYLDAGKLYIDMRAHHP